MAKKDFIEKEGIVKESLPDGMFRVEFPDGLLAIAQVSGKMRLYHIKILPGDRVKVEFSPYDPKRGRITFRGRA